MNKTNNNDSLVFRKSLRKKNTSLKIFKTCQIKSARINDYKIQPYYKPSIKLFMFINQNE